VRTTFASAATVNFARACKVHFQTLTRALFASRTLSLIDQAVVSGTSLFVTIAIGRFTVPSQLGIYALTASLIIALQNLQNALISAPYTIQRHRPSGTPAEHAGNALALCGLLSVIATIVMLLVAWIVDAQSEKPILEAAVWSLAAMAPFILLREFGRDFAFAHLQMSKVLFLDLGVAAAQVGILSYLAWSGLLSPATALTGIGAACGLTGLVWIYLDRKRFLVRANRLAEALRQSWRLGRWILANQLTLVAQVNLSYWLTVVIAGTAATGIYAACMCVASLANPLVLGLSNIMFAQATLAFKQGGYAKLRHDAFQETLLLGVTMSGFCLVIVFAGEEVLHLFFTQKAYVGHGDVLVALAVWQLAHAVGIPPSNALAAMEHVRLNFYIGLGGTCITVVLIAVLMIQWGLLGAAIGLLIGSAARSATRWVVFLTITEAAAPSMSSSSNAEAATRVLRQFMKRDDGQQLEMAQIDVGSQAHVFTMRSRARQPVWLTHRDLVVKLYKPEKDGRNSAASEQCDSLLVLHDAIHGLTVQGWKILVSEPLHVSESPPALVMTMVPGRKLNLCLETGEQFTRETMDSAALAIAVAMQRCWSAKGFHGDLAFHNIMCDVESRRLSFVDAGALENCCKYEGVIRSWNPAVHDLAHILCDVSSNVKHAIVNRGAHARSQYFSTKLLWAWIESIDSVEEKRRMLDELRDCTRLHIRASSLSISPHGLWLAITRWIALRRVDTLLNRMRTQIALPSQALRAVCMDQDVPRLSLPMCKGATGEVRQNWSRGLS